LHYDGSTVHTGGGLVYNGSFLYDGSQVHSGYALPKYCLFDVAIPYNPLLGLTLGEYTAAVTAMIESLRDGGTQLRTLTVS
jgi:hypothetical protein